MVAPHTNERSHILCSSPKKYMHICLNVQNSKRTMLNCPSNAFIFQVSSAFSEFLQKRILKKGLFVLNASFSRRSLEKVSWPQNEIDWNNLVAPRNRSLVSVTILLRFCTVVCCRFQTFGFSYELLLQCCPETHMFLLVASNLTFSVTLGFIFRFVRCR